MTPAIKSALTPLESLLVQIEYARDPDHALDLCREFPVLIRALVEVLGDEGATADPPANHGGEHAALPGRWAAAVTEPDEAAEDVARRLGLHVAEYSKDHRYGSVVWQNRGGTWEAETSSATYPDALSALHAYAASVGK